ncbi:MAG: efflux RND transporter periplasmic adaptor subunit [Nitrospirae bacterium]|nr:efflux RND transporter periplasmic adaptor subunit [Nitrospirota bacterium]
MKKRLGILILVLIAASAVIFLRKANNKVVTSISKAGIVQALEANITSKTAGKLSFLCCGEGDFLDKGSVVARLENNDLDALIKQAEASVRRAGADIETAKAKTEAAKAEMEEAASQLKRKRGLLVEGLVSRADFEDAQRRNDAAEANYRASLSMLSSAEAGRKEAEAMLSVRKAQLMDTVIESPMSGTVVYKSIETGEFVSPGASIISLIDMNDIWVRIDVEETKLGTVAIGDDAVITSDAVPGRTIKGKVSEIGRYAEFATQRDVKSGQQDIKTFHIKIKVDDAEKMLKPGMTVNAEIPFKR